MFKPMLASAVKDITTDVKFPCLVSPKLDGIRALVIDGQIVSRNLKPIRNKHIQNILGHAFLNGLDGELIVGASNGAMVYRRTSSGVMSEDGEPEFTFFVFDNYLDPAPYATRLANLQKIVDNLPETVSKYITVLVHLEINDVQELRNTDRMWLEGGYEGSMVRSLNGPYKNGRSTLKEGYLLKVKEFTDYEATIIGFKERMHNANEATVDALGHTERSMHKENMIPRGDLGAFLIEYLHISNDELIKEGALKEGETPAVGSGMDDALRKLVWDNKEKYLGKIITVKSFDYGDYVIPRFPIFKDFRDKSDMSE